MEMNNRLRMQYVCTILYNCFKTCRVGQGIAHRGSPPTRGGSFCITVLQLAFFVRCQVPDANTLAFETTTTSAGKPDGVVESPSKWRTERRGERTTDIAIFSTLLLAGPQTRPFRLRRRTPILKRLLKITEQVSGGISLQWRSSGPESAMAAH